jgi:hypothetical protein
VSTINIGTSESLITGFCVSPSEPDLVAICKNDGNVQLIAKIFDKKTKVVNKNLEAYCSNFLNDSYN